jgi:serine/threonine-protein kinase
MAGKVTLEVLEGPITGQVFPFEDHDTFLFGRSHECQACLSDDPKVSRHHFILEVNPPDARVRDLGSMNGTYVNDTMHGGREEGETPEQGAQRRHDDVNLKDGDRVRAGDTVFLVRIEVPAFCCECGSELLSSNREQSRLPNGTFLCSACKAKASPATMRDVRAPSARKAVVVRCKKCGKDVSNEAGARGPGDYVCVSCRAQPLGIARLLLERAKARGKGLLAIEGYTLLKELGRGGMGAVYLAKQDKSGQQVALKVMLPQVAMDERAKQSFLREVDVTKQLRHPLVVEFRDSGCSEGTFFFTLEFCDGGSVDKLALTSGGHLRPDEAVRIILQVLDGLEYVHNAPVHVTLANGQTRDVVGVVHRDMSPQNILLSGPSKVAKISDCGLSKAFETAGLSGHTMSGTVAGKLVFMPRQQIINYKCAKPEVDVWSAAACLYNMLTGQFPRNFLKGRDPVQIILSTDAVPIRERNLAVPARLAEVIDHALRDKPEIPFKTAAELKRALEEAT